MAKKKMTPEQIEGYRARRRWGHPAHLAFKASTGRPLSGRSLRRPQREIVGALVRTYRDSGQTKAYIEWNDGSRTEGEPGNPHMESLFSRAKRENIRIRHETW